jgi:hypothetical protein
MVHLRSILSLTLAGLWIQTLPSGDWFPLILA